MEMTLDMSGMFGDEGFQRGKNIDFRTLEGTSCFCSEETEMKLEAALGPYGPEGLRWIDSGDYHYLSLFFIRKIREPFSLILIDNHPDDQEGAFGEGLLSCGNWVKKARETLPLMSERECGRPVYISLDLDILSPEVFSTDWSQGAMGLNELMSLLDGIFERNRVIGIDVCGGLTRGKGANAAILERNRCVRETLADYLSEKILAF